MYKIVLSGNTILMKVFNILWCKGRHPRKGKLTIAKEKKCLFCHLRACLSMLNISNAFMNDCFTFGDWILYLMC